MKKRTAVLAGATAVIMTAGIVIGVKTGALPMPTGSTGTASDSPPAKNPLERFEQQKIVWHSCVADDADQVGQQLHTVLAQCADITVPLDYTKPDGPTINVSIARREATDRAHRLGTLMINGDGPGATQSQISLIAAGEPNVAPLGMPKLADRYDLVSMDPRFVGRSTPLTCDWPAGSNLRSVGTGSDRRGFERSVALNKNLAARCAKHKDLLPHASTRNVARDMDIVRAVLGEQKTSFLGWSYGAYLGAVYMQMFPQRVNRIVLDSSPDPDTYGPMYQGQAETAAIRTWAAWAADRDRRYHFGRTVAKVLASIDAIKRAADQGRKLRVGRYKINAKIAVANLPLGRTAPQNYEWMSDEVQMFHDAALGRKVTPTSVWEPWIAGLSQNYASDKVFVEDSGLYISLCSNRAVPRDVETYLGDSQAHRTGEPPFAARDVNPCMFWPTKPVEPPTKIANNLPALIVSAKGDPVSPYSGQEALRHALTGSRMIILNGANRHGVYLYGQNPCVDDAVNDYLLNGELRAADSTCELPRPRGKA